MPEKKESKVSKKAEPAQKKAADKVEKKPVHKEVVHHTKKFLSVPGKGKLH